MRCELDVATSKIGEWAFVHELLASDSIVYSLGVGDSVEFDPTPYAVDWIAKQTLPAEFVFKPWAASGTDGSLRLYRRVDHAAIAA
ncbi:MAG: hypothetical protein IID57_05640 [Proteobacteria bacterium]|nr:hypothetical protein [Pseudomonadota bacterium]